MGGHPARRCGHARHPAFRVSYHEQLRAHPRTGLRAVPFPHDPRPDGRGHAARSPCRPPTGAVSRRAGGHGARPRPTPPSASSSSDALLVAQSLRRAPSPEPRRNNGVHSRRRRAHETQDSPVPGAGDVHRKGPRGPPRLRRRRRHRGLGRGQRERHAAAGRRSTGDPRGQHDRHRNHRCFRPLRDSQPSRGIVQRGGPLPGLPSRSAGHRRGADRGRRPGRLPPGSAPDQPVGGRGQLDRAARGRHALGQPDLQTERLSRGPHQHDVADPAAIDSGRGAGAHRRSPHTRPAR